MNVVHLLILGWYILFSFSTGIILYINPDGDYDIENIGLFMIGSGFLHLFCVVRPNL